MGSGLSQLVVQNWKLWGYFCFCFLVIELSFPRCPFSASYLFTRTFDRMVLPKDAVCNYGGSIRF